MGQPAARQQDPVTGTDVHVVLTPSPGGPVPTPVPLPFSGQITGGTSSDVLVNGRPAAVVGSAATNLPPHLPPPGTSFSRPPTNAGRVVAGSAQVLVNATPMARVGDTVLTCNDPVDAPTGTVTGGSPDVLVG